MKKIPSIVALFCILIYVAAVLFAAFRVYQGIENQNTNAVQEVNSLAGMISRNSLPNANSAQTIQDAISGGRTLEGIIITGSIGSELVFEREEGKTIRWDGDSPRFIQRFGVINLPVKQVPGLKNVNIYAVYNTIDYGLFISVLKQTLVVILGTLAAAFLTLIIQSMQKVRGSPVKNFRKKDYRKKTVQNEPDASGFESMIPETSPVESGLDADFDFADFSGEPEEAGSVPEPAANRDTMEIDVNDSWEQDIPPQDDLPDFEASDSSDESGLNDFSFQDTANTDDSVSGTDFALDETFTQNDDFDFPPEDGADIDFSAEEAPEADENQAKENETVSGEPRGLFSPRSELGWEQYTRDRLDSELKRCAEDQDLVLMLLECGKNVICDDALYKKLAEETSGFFKIKDLVFEKGEKGISVIIPNTNLDQGIKKAGEFHLQILKNLFGDFNGNEDLRIGLSSRAGRGVDADRLFIEAAGALEKAEDSESIVAFRIDPEKYKQFINRLSSKA